MKTLVLTRFRPDKPAGGAALRNWQNIQALAQLGPVDVISVGEEDGTGSPKPVRRWTGFSHERLRNERRLPDKLRSRFWKWMPNHHPGLGLYFHSDVCQAVQKQVSAEKYDLGVIEELSLAQYGPLLAKAGCHVIYDAHNVETKLRSEIAATSQKHNAGLMRRLHAEEKKIIERSDLIWTCSELDSKIVRESFPRAPALAVVPNGVDVDSYQAVAGPLAGGTWSSQPLTVVYTGSFSYRPNTDAALTIINELIPALSTLGHKPKIILVGRDPHPSMHAAASGNPNIQITGPVESIMPYLSGPCVVALPILLGSGTRLKILEAFAAGRPVVSTAKGCEGIEAIDGEQILVRDDIAGMAQAVVQVWNDQTFRRKICESALVLVRKKYSWQSAAIQIRNSLELIRPNRISS